MEVQERLARLVLQNVSAATHAARKLRQGTALELRLEPTAAGSLHLIAFHDGRLLGRVEPIPREYIEWIRTCKDNRCTVDSIPVAEQDHLLKLILVRLERGQPILPDKIEEAALAAKPLPSPGPEADVEPIGEPEPEPEPEPDPEPVPEPDLPPEQGQLPVIMQPVQMPDLMGIQPYDADDFYDPPQPSALRRHGPKVVLILGFLAITVAAASGVHYLNTPCGRLWAKLGGTSNCSYTPDQSLYFETSKPNANLLCNPQVANVLPEVKLMRITLTSASSPVLVTCRLNK